MPQPTRRNGKIDQNGLGIAIVAGCVTFGGTLYGIHRLMPPTKAPVPSPFVIAKEVPTKDKGNIPPSERKKSTPAKPTRAFACDAIVVPARAYAGFQGWNVPWDQTVAVYLGKNVDADSVVAVGELLAEISDSPAHARIAMSQMWHHQYAWVYPVSDVRRFAARMTFGQVTEVSSNARGIAFRAFLMLPRDNRKWTGSAESRRPLTISLKNCRDDATAAKAVEKLTQTFAANEYKFECVEGGRKLRVTPVRDVDVFARVIRFGRVQNLSVAGRAFDLDLHNEALR